MIVPQYNPQLASPPPAMGYDSETGQNMGLREYAHILLKRKWWIIGTFLSIFLLVGLYTFLRTPIYRASTSLQITQDNPASRLSAEDQMSKLVNGGESSEEKFMQTQYKILESWSMAQRVVQALNLTEHPKYKFLSEQHPEKSKSEIEAEVVDLVSSNLQVTPGRNSYLVEVAFQSPSKELAQKVVNAVADEYMYLVIDRRNQSFTLVRKWLDKQLQEMADQLQEAQKKLYQFGQKTDIYTLGDKDNVIVQKFVDLSSLLTKAQAEKLAKEAQFQQIKEKGPNAPLIVNNPLTASLRQQLVTQQAKVSGMKKVMRDGHPDLQAEMANLAETKSRLQAEVNRLQDSVEADYQAAMRAEKLLSEGFTAQKGQMVKLQENLIDFQILKRDAQTNEQLYQALLARVKEASIAGTMVPSNVAVIDSARLPIRPYKPKTVRDLALAALLGLALGVGMALLMENLDDSIKSLDDLERACSLSSLGLLPFLGSNGSRSLSRGKQLGASGMWRYFPRLGGDAQGNTEAADMDLIVFKHPQSQVSEAISHVYSSLMLSTSGRPPGIILITSPNPSEGKTMVASNLAQSYALNDRTVVLIDCDLRKPRIHKIFQIDTLPGLSNYLTGNATLDEILHPTMVPNLTIISAGPRPPSPANLLNSEVFKELLDRLRQRFNHIIIDTPPVLGFADARFLSMLADGVVLVTKYNKTHKSAGHLAHQLLNQAPVLGAVLNAVGIHGQTYGGYYYYYSHYKYYSKYYGNKETESPLIKHDS
jgi:capsular exopolysaccharide synthesis family protein